VNEANQRLESALLIGKKWTALSAACRDLLSKTSSLSAEESFQQHTKVIEDTIALIGDVADASNLTLDPDIDSYYLMNVLIFQGPELSEILAQARGLGSSMAATKKVTSQQFETLNRLAVLVDFLQKKVDESLNKALKFNEALRPQVKAWPRVDASVVREAVARIFDIAATDYFSLMTRNINAIFEMESNVTGLLNVLLNKRVEKFQREVLYTLAWAMLGVVVVSVIGFFIMRDITLPLGRVVGIANQIATGDLAVPAASASRKDEIGMLAKAFDKMVTSLREMVGVAERIAAGDLTVQVKPQSGRDVMGNALANMVERLSTLAGEVHRSRIQVNTSVNEIAATTTEIGATSKEISATSKELVRTMNEVSSVAEQSANLASSGQAGLTHMEDTMQRVMEAAGTITAKLAVLNEKAGNINQVVTTITKVADQTNLLSLNAAIEAEKAGEYGRGFAVVATEIRRLADQTAVATYDIEQMVKEIQSAVSAGVMGMDKFSDEVRRGMQEVQQVGGQLSQIIQEVQALAPRVESVNEGMQAQATGAEQITEALGQLSQAAQQTVESLRGSSSTIDGLNQAANGMGNRRFPFQVGGLA